MSNLVLFSSDLIPVYFQSRDQFPVPFEGLWQQIGYSKKSNALRQLKSDLLEGLDFCSISSKSNGGRPSEDYFLAYDSARLFAIQARTEEGRTLAKSLLAEYDRLKQLERSLPTPGTTDYLVYQVEALAQAARQLQQVEKNQAVQQQILVSHESRLDYVESELGRFQDPDGSYYTARAFQIKQGLTLSLSETNKLGKTAAAYCREHNITIQKVSDVRYGSVGAYPEKALLFALDQVKPQINTLLDEEILRC